MDRYCIISDFERYLLGEIEILEKNQNEILQNQTVVMLEGHHAGDGT